MGIVKGSYIGPVLKKKSQNVILLVLTLWGKTHSFMLKAIKLMFFFSQEIKVSEMILNIVLFFYIKLLGLVMKAVCFISIIFFCIWKSNIKSFGWFILKMIYFIAIWQINEKKNIHEKWCHLRWAVNFLLPFLFNAIVNNKSQ